jgi:hypothetical protein
VRRSNGSRSLNHLGEIQPSVVRRRDGEGKAALSRLAVERGRFMSAAAVKAAHQPEATLLLPGTLFDAPEETQASCGGQYTPPREDPTRSRWTLLLVVPPAFAAEPLSP